MTGQISLVDLGVIPKEWEYDEDTGMVMCRCPVCEEQLIKSGFKEDEWQQFCDDWFTACLRIAEAFRVNVPWLRRD